MQLGPSLDDQDEECLDVLRNAESEFLGWRRIPWVEIEQVLGGSRAAQMVNVEKVLPQLRNAEFMLDSLNDEWLWMRLGPHHAAVVPVLLEHLRSNRTDLNIAVAESLARLRTSPVAVPALAKLLNDQRAAVRASAAEALAEFGPTGAAAIPELERATKDEYLTVKFAAEDALRDIQQ